MRIQGVLDTLRNSTRRGILDSFNRRPGWRTVDEVAESAGVHRTVAFTHLERLAELGLLKTERRRGMPGKPAKIYARAGGAIELSFPARRYQQLGVALASGVEELGREGTAVARAAGRRLGRTLAIPATSVAAALEAADQFGAEYAIAGGTVEAGNCVFREVCDRAPVVCELHAGLLEGLFEASGLPHSVTPAGAQGVCGCAYTIEEIER